MRTYTMAHAYTCTYSFFFLAIVIQNEIYPLFYISDTLKYLLEGACVHYCPDGYFKYDRGDSALIHTCELCDDSCKTCTGYGSDECTECEDGLIRDGNLRCVEPSDFDCTVPNCEGCLNG